MKTGYIWVGFLFLINPDLITLDVFPDFIGYLLIAKGLYRSSFLDERIAVARKYSFLLAMVSGFKLLANLIVFSTNVESTRMTVAFFFFLAEIFLSVLMVRNAYGGLQYLAFRFDGNLALKSYDIAKSFSVLFVIVKSVMAFLPSSVAIFLPQIDADPELVEGYSSLFRTFRSVRSILFLVSAVVTVTLGIYVLRILRAYLERCRSEEAFREKLLALFDEKVTNNPSMQTRLAVKSSFRMFFISILCLADFYVDDISLIPFPLFFVFAYLGLRELKNGKVVSIRYSRISLVGGAVSLVGYVYRIFCCFWKAEDFHVYFATNLIALILGAAGMVFAMIIGAQVASAIRDCAKRYTGYSYLLYEIALILGTAFLAAMGFVQFRFPSTYTILPATQWGVVCVLAYFHKKSLDEIRDEIDYQLM